MFASFGHLGGYSSAYYTYMWSLVIAKDLFSAFDPDDLFDARGRRPLPRPGARPRRQPGRRRPGRRLPRPPVHLRRVRRLARALAPSRPPRPVDHGFALVPTSAPRVRWRYIANCRRQSPRAVATRATGRSRAWDSRDSTGSGRATARRSGTSTAAAGGAVRGAAGRPAGRRGPPGTAAVGGRPLRARPGRAAARPAGPPRRRPRRRSSTCCAPRSRTASRSTATRSSSRSPSAAAAPGARAPARSTRPSSSSRTRAWSRPTTSAAGAPCGSPPRARRTSPSNADELAAVWAPFEARRSQRGRAASPTSSPRSARSWARSGRSSTTGTDQQRRDAVEILVDTRRRLYGLLADGDRGRGGREP